MHLLADMIVLLEQEYLEEFIMTTKKIWQRRNSFIFQDNFIHPKLVIQHTKQLLTKSISRGTSESNRISWEPPPLGTYKVNWDTVVRHEVGRVGICIVIRDSEGRVVASMSMQRYMLTDSYIAKSQRALQTDIFAREIGLRRIILEGDALQVIHNVKINTSQF